MSDSSGLRLPDLHPARPCVYLDQWVWIRLARAANGEPREASDLRVLAAVQDAAAEGVAFPLSHVVVPDREMTSLLSRSRAAERHRTQIITALPDLPDALPDLAEQARNALGDRTGWDWAGPWDGYCLDWSELADSATSQQPAA